MPARTVRRYYHAGAAIRTGKRVEIGRWLLLNTTILTGDHVQSH